MGIYDRDYTRAPADQTVLDDQSSSSPPPSEEEEPAPSVGDVGLRSVSTWLILINTAIYFGDHYLSHNRYFTGAVIGQMQTVRLTEPMPWCEFWGHFSIAQAIFAGQVWRFITYQFLHASFWHLLFNMALLYFFGPLVEGYLGRRRFLAFYLISGCFGAVGYMVLWATRTPFITSAYFPLVGASAGLFGILIAATNIAPQATVMVYGLIPMRLRALAWVMLGVAVFTVLTYGPNAGGEAAHLGGAAAGYVMIKNQHLLDHFDSARSRWRRRRTWIA